MDNVCSNVSLKHNILYVSASRLIHNEISNCTDLGKKLLSSRKIRNLENYGNFSEDESDLPEYNAVHYDSTLVYQLINE